MNISSFRGVGNQACTEEKLHTWVEYFTVGLYPISEKYFYNSIHVLYSSSSVTSWKQAKKCLSLEHAVLTKCKFY
jgi:hypothetical protein